MNTNVRAVYHLTMLAVPHLEKTKVGTRQLLCSVVDPGFLSRIRIFSIPDPNFFSPDPGFVCKEFKYCDQKNVSELSEIWSGCLSRIRILIFYLTRIRRSKRHRIPDPQHCFFVRIYIQRFAGPYINPFSVPVRLRNNSFESLSVLCLWICCQ